MGTNRSPVPIKSKGNDEGDDSVGRGKTQHSGKEQSTKEKGRQAVDKVPDQRNANRGDGNSHANEEHHGNLKKEQTKRDAGGHNKEGNGTNRDTEKEVGKPEKAPASTRRDTHDSSGQSKNKDAENKHAEADSKPSESQASSTKITEKNKHREEAKGADTDTETEGGENPKDWKTKL